MVWGKAGSTTLSSANTDISVTSISTNIFYQSMNHVFATSGNVAMATSYNGDTATSSNRYAMRKNNNGTEDPLNSRDEIYLTSGDTEIFGIAYHAFISGEEKLMIGHAVGKGTAGAGYSPNSNEGVGKYVPTDLTDTMSSMNIEAQNSSNTYTSDSNLSVLGSDMTPAGTVPAVPAVDSVQDNSIFVETDTARRYWFDEATTPTTTFDYSNTTGWTFTNSAITNTGGECVMTSGDASNDVRGYKSLGTTLSDTVWTADFEFEHSDESPRAAGMPFCITAGTGIPASATQDMLGVKTFTSSNVIFPMYKDGSGSVTTGSTITLTFGTKYYCRLSRTTATNLELKVFSDSSRSTQVGSTINLTIPSTITTLTTLQHAISPGSSGDKMNFNIDNTKIYNGTTSVTPATWTMQPTYEDDSFSSGWTSVGTYITANSSTNVIDFDVPDALNRDLIYHDLGAGNVSDTAWILRFKWSPVFQSNSDGTQPMIFATLSDNISNAVTSQDAIGFVCFNSSGGQFRSGLHVNGSALGDGDTTNMRFATDSNVSQTEWVEIKRNSATSITVSTYSDEYSTLIESKTYASVSSSIIGLRYVKFVQRCDDTTTNGQVSGTIDNVQFYNGVTSV